MSSQESQNQYRMSFTTGGLFYNESLRIVEEYLSTNDWDFTRQAVIEKNLIQSRTESSVRRRVLEIFSRLELLSKQQVALLVNGSRSEQQYLLWLAICKRYSFIHEFAVEIVREKFLRLDLLLTLEEYDRFFSAKASWHVELDKLTSSTYVRLRQVLFKMLREAEIIEKTGMIIPALFTQELVAAIATEDPQLLCIFPLSDMDIQEWLK